MTWVVKLLVILLLALALLVGAFVAEYLRLHDIAEQRRIDENDWNAHCDVAESHQKPVAAPVDELAARRDAS